MGTTVGIDLGTTNSAVAVLEGKTPRMVLSDSGSNVTPSAIWGSPSGELVVGAVAYRKAGSVRRFKRDMGSDTALQLGDRALSPEDASSLILRKLVEDAEKTLRKNVDSAVITVPANWKDGPRRATEAAGRLAGLRVERLINEPTAAAMAYGMREDADGKTIAVYDLGGGTFDITLLRIHQKVFDVITSNGDERLGGTDFDMKLMRLVLERLTGRTGYSVPPDSSQDDKMRQRMRDLEWACEEAKKELSFAGESAVSVPFLDLFQGGPIGVEERITRSDLEKLIEGDVERTLQYMESALRAAKLQRQAIDEVVLVGGSSRIPLVRQRVADFFGKEPLTSAVNPDEAVALGAAIQAGIISQDEVDEGSSVVLDIINNTLGVEVVSMVGGRLVGGVFSPILAKGLKVPAMNTEPYYPASDNQTSVMLRCFEGESPVTQGNTFLDEIRVDGLPPRPAGEVQIQVMFTKTVNDMLEVGWNVQEANIQGTHTIHMRSGLHSAEELEKRKKAMDDLWGEGRPGAATKPEPPSTPPEPDWRSSSIAQRYRALIERAESAAASTSDAKARGELDRVLRELKIAVTAGDGERAEELDLELTDLLFDLE